MSNEQITVVISKYAPNRQISGGGINASTSGGGLNFNTTVCQNQYEKEETEFQPLGAVVLPTI